MQVYKAMRSGVTVVAVKVMGETQAGQMQANKVMQQTELFEREILLLKSCRDRNIVQFLGACMQVSTVLHRCVQPPCLVTPGQCSVLTRLP